MIPEHYYSMILINKKGEKSQLTFLSISKDIYAKLGNHIVLGVLKIDSKSKKIISIENSPILNNLSGYQPPIPLPPSKKIWRYLEFYKFEDLIKSSALYLSRIDKFEDNLEGISPSSCKHSIQIDNRFSQEKKDEHIRLFEERTEYNRKSSFVCCWHINDNLNEDMWDSYGKDSKESVAIETSTINLEESTIDSPIPFVFEKIRYYEEPFFNQETYWFPSLFKTKKFEPEKEYRSAIYFHNRTNVEFVKIPINLESLITKIHLHPEASQFHKTKIAEMIKSSGLSIPISWA